VPGGSACRDVAPRRARDEMAEAPRAASGGFLRALVQGVMMEKGVASMMGDGVGGVVVDGG